MEEWVGYMGQVVIKSDLNKTAGLNYSFSRKTGFTNGASNELIKSETKGG